MKKFLPILAFCSLLSFSAFNDVHAAKIDNINNASELRYQKLETIIPFRRSDGPLEDSNQGKRPPIYPPPKNKKELDKKRKLERKKREWEKEKQRELERKQREWEREWKDKNKKKSPLPPPPKYKKDIEKQRELERKLKNKNQKYLPPPPPPPKK